MRCGCPCDLYEDPLCQSLSRDLSVCARLRAFVDLCAMVLYRRACQGKHGTLLHGVFPGLYFANDFRYAPLERALFPARFFWHSLRHGRDPSLGAKDEKCRIQKGIALFLPPFDRHAFLGRLGDRAKAPAKIPLRRGQVALSVPRLFACRNAFSVLCSPCKKARRLPAPAKACGCLLCRSFLRML